MRQRNSKKPAVKARSSKAATVSVDEAAEMIGIGRTSVYTAIRLGQLPSLRLGKRLLVPRAALEELLSGGVRVKISA
jgi:excisionase family DNA binding protein